ncbi:MAG TPA: D-2-hydroxyacid dehydrogenase [Chloroflexota bacterium]|nr:D-2-hydroxyacid dehydrogenase [Chloroflexota bacterium]
MTKLVMLEGTPALADELRAAHPGLVVELAADPDDQARAVADADALYGLPKRDVFRAARRVRWIHCPGTGIDPIWSVPELVDGDVVLTNARGPHAEPMADHVFAQLLALTHHIPRLLDDQRAHRWATRSYDPRMVELAGKTMGVVALGGIGQAVARRAHGFGMRVLAVRRHPTDPPPYVEAVWPPDRLDDLLAQADVLAVTVPLTPETRGMLDARRIGLMRPGSYLIVVSRGGIVDEAALLEALRGRRLAGAGLDVTATEPLPPDSPLWDAPNLLISPHVSALTPEMWAGRRAIFKENLRRFLAGEPFLHVCDKEAGY